jgi:mRNA-degrading endonuclease RelE of RelBE toxin-antitoxin system
MFAIKIKQKALRKLAKLSGKQRQSMETVIVILKNDPYTFQKVDVCKPQGYENTYRIQNSRHNHKIVCQSQNSIEKKP